MVSPFPIVLVSIIGIILTFLVHLNLKILPIAHACTCFLLHVNCAVFIKDSKYLTLTNDQERVRYLLRHAWKLQMEPTPFLKSVDVDREALEALEEKMFECSSKAGPAGNMQWGLDAGPLQNSWSPYLLDWSDGTRK